MEINDATTSGDGTVANVGVRIAGGFQCPDCRQKFDSERAKQVHRKFSHNSGCDWEGASEPADAPEEECAICFDAVAVRAALPCDCRVPYCGSCWDRALAQSFKSVGQARCPSCRGPISVDFDDDAAGGRGRLVFSCGTQEKLAVRRLANKAAPVQIRLLQRFGASRPFQEIAQEPRQALRRRWVCELKKVAMGCSAVVGTGKAELVSSPASKEERGPECVCGGTLTRIGGRARARASAKMISPDIPDDLPEHSYAQVVRDQRGGVLCKCGLCGSALRLDSTVWTCSNGRETILHTSCYDVCEACFTRHAVDSSQTSHTRPAADRRLLMASPYVLGAAPGLGLSALWGLTP